MKDVLVRIVTIVNKGLDKVIKICRFLGIKVERKPSGAMVAIVANRFKKDKKDFIEYEIDQLNKTIDGLEEVDEKVKLPPPGPIPPDISPNNLYPQKMPLGAPIPPPPPKKEVHDLLVGDHQDPPPPPPLPVPPPPVVPPPPPKKDIPSVMPEPPKAPPKGANGIK